MYWLPECVASGTIPGRRSCAYCAGFSFVVVSFVRRHSPPWSQGSMAEMPHVRWLRQLSRANRLWISK